MTGRSKRQIAPSPEQGAQLGSAATPWFPGNLPASNEASSFTGSQPGWWTAPQLANIGAFAASASSNLHSPGYFQNRGFIPALAVDSDRSVINIDDAPIVDSRKSIINIDGIEDGC